MKKIFIILSMVALGYNVVTAQDSLDNRHEKFKAIRIGFITNQLNLTSNEAKLFWPQYESYTAEIKAEIGKNAGNEMLLEENILQIRKKYFIIFKNILNDDERVNKLYKLEREFAMRVKERMGKFKHRGH